MVVDTSVGRRAGAASARGPPRRLDADHAELKSMRTTTARRRSGLASLLLEHLIAEARGTGFTRLSPETVSAESFRPARRLYRKFGCASSACGPSSTRRRRLGG
ncbi:GNAT family N-acetyltransferase [Streptomyces sp. NPDC007070]|uniref:GNAT family N-acetyltransferase n=1 Tax=Streptomyces sp. NPDC007070 TaxID=3154312 RepID=UPI0033E62A88